MKSFLTRGAETRYALAVATATIWIGEKFIGLSFRELLIGVFAYAICVHLDVDTARSK